MTTAEAIRLEEGIDSAVLAGNLEQAETWALLYLDAEPGGPPRGDLARSPWFRARYCAGKVALATGRLSQALDRLLPLLATVERISPDLAGRVRLLVAEALTRLRRGEEGRALLEEVPASLLVDDLPSRLRALCIRLWLGEVASLRQDLDDCLDALGKAGETANRVLLLTEEGRAWDAAGDLARARDCLNQAEELSRGLGDHPIRADVLLQRGRLDHLCGHLPAAMDRFAEALSCNPSRAQALEIQLRRLLVLLDMNHSSLARKEAEPLLQELSLDELPEEVIPLVRFVRGLLEETDEGADTDEQQAFRTAARGDVRAARRLYRRAVVGEPSPQRRARLALALGLLALAEDDRNEARSWLGQAEEPARSLDLPEILGRALQGRGRIAAELDADDESARPLFEEAVTLFEIQAAQFSSVRDAMLYRRQQEGVLRHLLRAACHRSDAEAVFRYQELDRGRLLLDLWQSAGVAPARVASASDAGLQNLQQEIDQCQAELKSLAHTGEEAECRKGLIRAWEKLEQRRDRLLERFLADRQRPASAALPRLPVLADLRRLLPAGVLCVAPSLVGGELYLLVVSRDEPARVVRAPGSADTLTESLARLRGCLTTQVHRYRHGLLRPADRGELDGCLDDLGRAPLGQALFRELAGGRVRSRRLLWVPDGPLHGLPVHALRQEGRYLIQDIEVVQSFSGALFVHQARGRSRWRGWWRPALVVSEVAEVLPSAGAEGEGVAASFFRSRILHGPSATRAALRTGLARARVAHFACHADFDPQHPLAATLWLPSGEALHAAEWFDEPVNGLALATLSACRAAEVAPLEGREVFGSVMGLLGAGVRAVLAGLWPLGDRETLPLMWSFYRHRLTCDLATALARAQREALAEPNSSPLFWAAFALFGDPSALPAPRFPWRLVRAWRQRRHGRRFVPPALDEG